VPWSHTLSLTWLTFLSVRSRTQFWMVSVLAVCALPLSHLRAANQVTSVPWHPWGLMPPVWFISSSPWGPDPSARSSARYSGWGWGVPPVRDLGYNYCCCWWWWCWWWRLWDPVTASYASSLTWSRGRDFQCCPSCYWSCSGCDTSVSYTAAGSSGSRAGSTGIYPAADVRMDAIHVLNHSGPSGNSAAAALGRHHWAPGLYDSYPSAYLCLAATSLVCPSSSSSGSHCASDSGRTPTSSFWSFSLSAPADHSGLLVTCRWNRQCSAASATSAAVTTATVAVSMTTSGPTDPAAQPMLESVPAPTSTADHGSETDSDPQLAFALLPQPRPDAPPPPPSSFGL
jgi:hypothetical protein